MTDADDKELAGNVHAFEAALRAVHQDLEPAVLRRLVLALDGSNQDDTTLGLSADLALRARALVVPVFGTRPLADEEASPYLHRELERLREAGVGIELLARPPGASAQPWELLRSAAQSRDAELIVLDAPYLEDFDAIGSASVGTNLDVLMARRETALLVARAPLAEPAAVFARVVLPIFVAARHQPQAAAWALRAIAPQGHLGVVAVVDDELLRRADWLRDGADHETLDPETLAGLREPKNAGLIAALQRFSARHSLGCRVSVRAGEVVPALLELAGDTPTLFVVPCPRDPVQVEFQRVQALVRASHWPVLLV